MSDMSVPTIIEDEPPHEFYASLLGISCKTSRSEIVVLPPPRLSDEYQNSRNEQHLVETSSLAGSSSCGDESDEIPSNRKGNHDTKSTTTTTTCSVYKRAWSDPMKLSSLALTSSNCKGYKLLVRMGWREEEGGLGRHRQGTLVPIRPNGNQEQRGLGFAAKRRRRLNCRHDTRNATKAVKLASVKTTRAQRRRLRQQQADEESQKMKRARMLLRSDVSDEYQELYMKLLPSG